MFQRVGVFVIGFLVVFGTFVSFIQFSNKLFNEVNAADCSSLRAHSVPGWSLHVLAEVAFAFVGAWILEYTNHVGFVRCVVGIENPR